MSVANVVSLEFESEQALQEFAEKYKAFGTVRINRLARQRAGY
jgi:hypothetical protein